MTSGIHQSPEYALIIVRLKEAGGPIVQIIAPLILIHGAFVFDSVGRFAPVGFQDDCCVVRAAISQGLGCASSDSTTR